MQLPPIEKTPPPSAWTRVPEICRPVNSISKLAVCPIMLLSSSPSGMGGNLTVWIPEAGTVAPRLNVWGGVVMVGSSHL